MEKRLYITGTDTGVGKTFVTEALTRGLRASAQQVQALKPIAAGCEWIDGRWRNEDALALQQAQGAESAYELINPIALRAAMAPHLAAAQEGVSLSVASTLAALQAALSLPARLRLIEGAGGWLVPLNEREDFADLAAALQTDVLLVVGMRLGCLNHALLSAQAIRARGFRLAGWVANHCQPETMAMPEANRDYLQQHLQAPLWAELPYGAASPATQQKLALALLANL